MTDSIKHADFLISLITRNYDGMFKFMRETPIEDLKELSMLLRKTGDIIDDLVQKRVQCGVED